MANTIAETCRVMLATQQENNKAFLKAIETTKVPGDREFTRHKATELKAFDGKDENWLTWKESELGIFAASGFADILNDRATALKYPTRILS